MNAFARRVSMFGAAGPGKPSLARRFVEGGFSERYRSTMGFKGDRKSVPVGNDQVNMLPPDIEDETGLRSIRLRHLRGAADCLLVADGTRPNTLAGARELQRMPSPTSAATGAGVEESLHRLADRLVPGVA